MRLRMLTTRVPVHGTSIAARHRRPLPAMSSIHVSFGPGEGLLTRLRNYWSGSPGDSKTLARAIGLLLKDGTVKRWHTHPEDRLRIESLLVDNHMETYLLVIDAAEFKATGRPYDEAMTLAGLQSVDVSEESGWMLVEPMPGGHWRKWTQQTAIILSDMRSAGQIAIENPNDPKKRAFSQHSLDLCDLLVKDTKLISPDTRGATEALLREVLKKKLVTAGKGAIALGVITCSVAAAVCTGVGAITITKSIAESIIKGGTSKVAAIAVTHALVNNAATSSATGGPGKMRKKMKKPPIPNESDLAPDQLLAARIDRLEHAIFADGDLDDLRGLGTQIAGMLQRP